MTDDSIAELVRHRDEVLTLYKAIEKMPSRVTVSPGIALAKFGLTSRRKILACDSPDVLKEAIVALEWLQESARAELLHLALSPTTSRRR